MLHGTYRYGDYTTTDERPDPALRRSPLAESIGTRTKAELPDCRRCAHMAACLTKVRQGDTFLQPDCNAGYDEQQRSPRAGSSHAAIIAVLQQAGAPMTAAQIKARIPAAKGNTVRDALTVLASRGLVERYGCVRDHRNCEVTLWRLVAYEAA